MLRFQQPDWYSTNAAYIHSIKTSTLSSSQCPWYSLSLYCLRDTLPHFTSALVFAVPFTQSLLSSQPVVLHLSATVLNSFYSNSFYTAKMVNWGPSTDSKVSRTEKNLENPADIYQLLYCILEAHNIKIDYARVASLFGDGTFCPQYEVFWI